jgi:molybdopterin molybdotransferase
MLSPESALAEVLRVTEPLPPRRVPLWEALGLVLAESLCADRDYPPFRRAMMDGYAVCAADAGRLVAVRGVVAAGQHTDRRVSEGTCLEIMTGACCPAGTEAVVEKERVVRTGDTALLPEKIVAGGHIAPPGSECTQGEVVLSPGSVISPLGVAAIASIGRESVLAIPRPRLAILVTGSELTPAGVAPGPVEIRDSNGPMLAAMAAELGLAAPLHLTVADREPDILEALAAAAAYDIVCLTGGVSVGTFDLVPGVLRRYGAETVFHKVAQKPGKPLLLARKGAQILFGLSGNPLGCHWCFHRYVGAALRRMEGRAVAGGVFSGRILAPLRSPPGRARFVPGVACWSDNLWQVQPQPGVSSADIFHTARANCYVHIPGHRAVVETGEMVDFSLFTPLPRSPSELLIDDTGARRR